MYIIEILGRSTVNQLSMICCNHMDEWQEMTVDYRITENKMLQQKLSYNYFRCDCVL